MQLLLRGFPSFNFFDLLREKCQPAKCRYYTGNWIINRSGYLSFRPTKGASATCGGKNSYARQQRHRTEGYSLHWHRRARFGFETLPEGNG